MLDEDMVDDIERRGIDEVRVRTPLTCDTRYGLCASVWTQDLTVAHRVARALEVGMVCVTRARLGARLPNGARARYLSHTLSPLGTPRTPCTRARRWVNTWLHRDLRTPFGGVKDSGVGREGGQHSLDFYSEQKNTCILVPAAPPA
jgi:aminomuconate-semialdehyde/2-hydroxymuconate-6-semialdehyde dehydrogenase